MKKKQSFEEKMKQQLKHDAKEKSLHEMTASKANPKLAGFGQGGRGVHVSKGG